MACYIRWRYNYDDYRRILNGYDSEDDEYESGVLGPEFFEIMIFGRPVISIYTNSEDFVNTWFFRHMEGIRRPVVGLHIRLLPTPGQSPLCYPPVASIHLCVDGRVLIYHMYNNATRLPIALQQFMTDLDNNTFVGVNVDYGMRSLRYWTEFIGNVRYRSLGNLTNKPELLNAGVTLLALNVLGKELKLNVFREELEMKDVNPDWDRHTLLDEQLLYATISAYVSYELGRALVPHVF